MDTLFDIPFWNFGLSVAIAVEGSFAFFLMWTKPKAITRPQMLILLGIVVLAGYLMVDTSAAQVWQVSTQQVLPGVSAVTFLAILLRVAIFVGLSTYLWTEWKDQGQSNS